MNKEVLLIKPGIQPDKVFSWHGAEHPLRLDEMVELLEVDYVEAIDISHGITLWVDEEALIKGEPPVINMWATRLMMNENPAWLAQPLMGNVLFTSTNADGETIALDKAQREFLEKSLSEHQPEELYVKTRLMLHKSLGYQAEILFRGYKPSVSTHDLVEQKYGIDTFGVESNIGMGR